MPFVPNGILYQWSARLQFRSGCRSLCPTASRRALRPIRSATHADRIFLNDCGDFLHNAVIARRLFDLSRASGGGNRRGVGCGTPTDRKLVVGDGAEKAERNFGNKDNDGPRSHGLLRIRNEILEENGNPVDVSKRNQKWLRDHRRKPASPGVPRKTEEDQSRRARYGNFSKAPKARLTVAFNNY